MREAATTATFRESMKLSRTFAFSLLFLLNLVPGLAQEQSKPLAKGAFSVGYRVLTLPYCNDGSDTIHLVLNLWYPTEKVTDIPMHLIDYLYYHKKISPPDEYDVFVENEIKEFKKFVEQNFGAFTPENWKSFCGITTNAFLNAPYPSDPFPLILGRLRAFSTTYTNEFLASHGYVICMLNGVDDFPPDNRPAYYEQVTNEIVYYDVVRSHLTRMLKIGTDKSGLMGFSGGGFSQFFAPMRDNSYDAVALLESGIFLDGDLFDIVSNHPYYNPAKFNTPLLFLYNKQRFEKNASSKNFDMLITDDKYLVLFKDSAQHHWDFATEGISSALFLNNRHKTTVDYQIKNFRVMNDLLLKFFDRYLKGRNNFTLPKRKTTVINSYGTQAD